jgi:hypothetical protein
VSEPIKEPIIARAWGTSAITRVLPALAVLYLAGVWLDGVGNKWPAKLLPRTANYFLQIAALFTRAGQMSIDYRAEAWSCKDKRWVEIDTRPYFPIDPDDKENRFQRAMHFHKEDRTTMQALERYLVSRHNGDAGPSSDGLPRDVKIGGTRFLSLRFVLPKPGDPITPMVRKPLSELGNVERHDWYWTTRARRGERCGAPVDVADDPPKKRDKDGDKDKTPSAIPSAEPQE